MKLAQFLLVSTLVFTWIGVEAKETKNAPEDLPDTDSVKGSPEIDPRECSERGRPCCDNEDFNYETCKRHQKSPPARSCCQGLSCKKNPRRYVGGLCAKEEDDVYEM